MINTKVRQPRIHTLDYGNHKTFTSYLSVRNYKEDDRAYILDVGVKLTKSVNDKFSRVSFPYNKSKHGYAVFVIPSEQIMISGNKSNFGETLCDIDIGNKYNKCTIKYTDKNDVVQQELISTKYVERYFNFASSAYKSGYYDGYDVSSMDIMNVMSVDNPTYYPDDYKAMSDGKTDFSEITHIQNEMMKYEYRRSPSSYWRDYKKLKDVYDIFVNPETNQFDYDAFRQKVVSKYDNMIKPNDITEHSRFLIGLSSSNKNLFLESYTNGVNDRFKHNLMEICYKLYPPEKDSKEYHKMLNSNFTEADYNSFVNTHDIILDKYEASKSDMCNHDSQSNGFVSIPNYIIDEELPFS